MEKVTPPLVVLLSWAALAGNILLILWLSYNAIKEHFGGTIRENVIALFAVGVLATNAFLILRNKDNKVCS